MAGLMDYIKYSYSSLAEKYKNFTAPTFKISVEGSDISEKLGLFVSDLSVELTIGENSGMARFNIINAYDLKTHSLNGSISSKLKLGAVVTVSVGYIKTTQVFKGYIANVNVNFPQSGAPAVSVVCMDARALMSSGKKHENIASTKFSQAYKDVMSNYSTLVSAKADLLLELKEEEETFKQLSSDFGFIFKNARERGYEFFIINDTAYLRESPLIKVPVTTLEWGTSLLSFSRTRSYIDLQVKVVGYDSVTKKQIETDVTAASDVPIKKLRKKKSTEYLPVANFEEPGAVRKRAKAEANRLRGRSAGGRCSCVGLPEIVPGRYIELKNLDSDIDGIYYITDVTHEISAGGFITNFTIGVRGDA